MQSELLITASNKVIEDMSEDLKEESPQLAQARKIISENTSGNESDRSSEHN